MLEIWLGAAGIAGGCGAAVLWKLKRRHGADLAGRTLRLASEIIEVADTIEDDVSALRDQPRFTRIAQRCRECTERSRAALTQRRVLRAHDPEALTGTLLLLHDDHRRIVDLRSETDRALATWVETHGHAESWASRFASTLSTSFSSTLTRRPSVG
jgi:hypothetical protein